MKVKLQFFRVYGSKFENSSSSHFITSKNQIKVEFPSKEGNSFVVLGKPCKSVFEANNIKIANAISILNDSPFKNNGIKRELTPEERDRDIEKELKRLNRDPKASDCNFYLTIIIEKEVNVPDENFVASKYFWLDYQKALDLEMKFESYASCKADFIAIILSILISNSFFQKIIIDSVYFSTEGKERFGIPVFKMDWQSNQILNGYEFDNLFKFLKDIELIPEELEELLDFVTHYKIAALMEKDQLKIFVFNFLALEVLINKIVVLVSKRVIEDRNWTSFIDSTDIHENNWKNKKSRERYLKTKFAIVSFALCPERALDNYNKFKKIKELRDDLSHGKIKLDKLKFPISELNMILNEYLIYSIVFHEKLFNK